MSVGTLARRNALDPIRSRSVWVLLGVFVIVFALAGSLLSDGAGSPAILFGQILVLLGPLAALAFSYGSVAGPRENGGLRVVLSYPYTRRDVVLGTFLGRAAVIALAVVVAVVTGGVATVVFGGTVPVGELAITLALSLLVAVAIVGLAVGISASVATTTRAAVLSFAAYLLFSGFWGLVPTAFPYVANGLAMPSTRPPEWAMVWTQLNPFTAYRSSAQALLQSPVSDAVYHEAWFGPLVLVAWLVLPLVVGLFRFQRTDL